MSPERKKKAAYGVLKAFLDQEKQMIEQNLKGLRDIMKKKATLLSGHELRAEALYIHDFYNSVENIFKNIADESGGGVPRGENWHKNLLLEMHTDFPKERKKIVSDETFQVLEEILRFRHLIRNSYGVFLDRSRTRKVSNLVMKTVRPFLKEIESYVSTLA